MAWNLGLMGAAGAVSNAFDLLETTVLSSAAASVSFSSLGSYSDYKHLQVRATLRLNSTSFNDVRDMVISINGATSNYAWHSLRGDGSTVSSGAGSSASSINVPNIIPRGGTSIFGAFILDILDFSNTNKNKTTRLIGGATNTSGNTIGLFSGLFASTNAVTSLEFKNDGGINLAAGSRFSLYGVK